MITKVYLYIILLTLTYVSTSAQKAAAVDVNNLYMPFNNNGILADVNFGPKGSVARYPGSNGKGIIFSGGFFLSGFKDGKLFANAVASASMVEDYKAGQVGNNPDNPLNKVYVIRKDDPPFGESWNEWKNAVQQGAYFYDGDGNGIYNPTDNNNNGIWEEDEDRPDLLYDATYFTVYNDGVPRNIRRWNTIDPLGIEIRQTIFASGTIPKLQDVIFIRYSILYKGLDHINEVDSLQDVIFSIWNDADIGSFARSAIDDLVGCDTTIHSGFVYNEGEDDDWGTKPPAVFRTILQGPLIKSNNSNDFAYSKMGSAIGQKEYLGWRNGGMASYRNYIGGDPQINDPNTPDIARNQMLGLDNFGANPNLNNWWFGEVRGGFNSDEVNPYYWYSGDPVSDYGWICRIVADQRDLVSTEQFKLVINEPMDIIVAYTVGQGTDALSSITDGRNKVRKVIEIYEQNFPGSYTPPNYEELYPKDFTLSQNYPNPFNPTTTIEYTIPNVGTTHELSLHKITITVYNILGQRVATLLDEAKSPGSYEVSFNASQLASGVYFYRLTSGSFVQTKKMMVVK